MAALIESTILVVTMGACSINKKEKTTYIEQAIENPKVETNKELTTSFSIFEDPKLLENIPFKEITFPEEEIEEEIEEVQFISRFDNQEQLETYLEQVYKKSGLNYWQIIDDADKNEDYTSYQNDLSASAAYMLLKDNPFVLPFHTQGLYLYMKVQGLEVL
jgi:hypothetical protein